MEDVSRERGRFLIHCLHTRRCDARTDVVKTEEMIFREWSGESSGLKTRLHRRIFRHTNRWYMAVAVPSRGKALLRPLQGDSDKPGLVT